ncbi:MAG TPA: hypothetical protein VLS49_11445, partial [Usitatibacter sp.]|nr:hypothetical protein [Usitatibacter sp.]
MNADKAMRGFRAGPARPAHVHDTHLEPARRAHVHDTHINGALSAFIGVSSAFIGVPRSSVLKQS